jgi:hypothetical protein
MQPPDRDKKRVEKIPMLRFTYAFVSLLLVLTLGSALAASARSSAQVKVSLQVAMQQHIDRSLVNGIYLYLDPTTGDVTNLYPVSPHPIIMRMGEFFVLCSNFRDDNGITVNVDFYMAQAKQGYKVFHTAVAQRDLLEQLIKAGKIERLD